MQSAYYKYIATANVSMCICYNLYQLHAADHDNIIFHGSYGAQLAQTESMNEHQIVYSIIQLYVFRWYILSCTCAHDVRKHKLWQCNS